MPTHPANLTYNSPLSAKWMTMEARQWSSVRDPVIGSEQHTALFGGGLPSFSSSLQQRLTPREGRQGDYCGKFRSMGRHAAIRHRVMGKARMAKSLPRRAGSSYKGEVGNARNSRLAPGNPSAFHSFLQPVPLSSPGRGIARSPPSPGLMGGKTHVLYNYHSKQFHVSIFLGSDTSPNQHSLTWHRFILSPMKSFVRCRLSHSGY